ncbi:hypothetical protein BJP36_36370 [Moorena producens JHB]|uniref:Uncharacterized protein n=1 Tax=Moorena producens (strain JHB) TaxID=1454205 RepID=A0A9Q9STY0_MOOP1|nr:hypothetical protein [Moorena producens]WAN69566.1 hypothetical protein BJP36_36370 [Moorena producens JHB]
MGETTAVAHGGDPQDRNGAFSALRIKFATGRTSASPRPRCIALS